MGPAPLGPALARSISISPTDRVGSTTRGEVGRTVLPDSLGIQPAVAPLKGEGTARTIPRYTRRDHLRAQLYIYSVNFIIFVDKYVVRG